MMAATLPIVAETPIAGTTVQTVRGRDVHAFLGVAKDFTTWMRVQIERARLKEGRDFVVEGGAEQFPLKGGNPLVTDPPTYSGISEKVGGRPRIEWHLTLDAAKHVGLISGTERGFELREYFIEAEKRAQVAPAMPAIPTTFAEALQLAADNQRQVEAQAAQIAVLAPRSEALATIADGEGTFCIRDAAKMLQQTETGLTAYLSGNDWIYRREPGGPWVATARRKAQGWITTKVVPVPVGDGKVWNKPQARITSAGLTVLALRLGKPVPPGLTARDLPLLAPPRA